MRSVTTARYVLCCCVFLGACSGSSSTPGDDSSTERESGFGIWDGPASDYIAPSGDAIIPSCGTLVAVIRDFKAWAGGDGHEDFENADKSEPGYDYESGKPVWSHGKAAYLATALDGEDKPRYLLGSQSSPSGSIHGADGFAQWYRDVDGVNQRFETPIEDQDPDAHRFTFDSAKLPGGEFFPIDGRGFGNQGNKHNYHFTTELSATFRYEGGEIFTFSGDDDVYVFVNGKLALDLGGIHGVKEATIDFDALADWLEIQKGGIYSLRLFHAERHVVKSNFRFTTSIPCLVVR